jgi:hypothetical protein
MCVMNGEKSKSLSQTQRFEETARALGCNEDEATFDVQLAVIVLHKPKAEPKPLEKGVTSATKKAKPAR